MINLPAEKDPVIRPVSPPTKRPPAVKKKYAATSPQTVGLTRLVTSGMGSVSNWLASGNLHILVYRHTGSSIGEADRHWLLSCFECIEHLRPRRADPESKKSSKRDTDERSNCCV